MSSARRHDTHLFRAISLAFALVAAVAVLLSVVSGASATTSKVPKITKVSPLTNVAINSKLSITGKNFVKGKKTLVVIFKRDGSKRKFTARGDASSSTRAVVVVPDLSGDLFTRPSNEAPNPLDNMYRLRPITKFGPAKAWTSTSISPRMVLTTNLPVNVGPAGDCDKDGIKNNVDTDDDNDLLEDTIELSIGTDVCFRDTDGDVMSDFYEYTVAYQYNGGPTLPYPSLKPYPNPLVPGDQNKDFDDDRVTTIQEYDAWQYTGLMSHFYSDADADSDDDGRVDSDEDEDNDLLPNHIEFYGMKDLNWLKTDTDGDGLCDGLDDQDHDGPPTPLASADCKAQVPNNGPLPAFPPTDPINTVPGGDPDPTKIDGDDNRYSNFYEWYNAGWDPNSAPDVYDQCFPSIYPVSPFCQTGQGWDPLPVPGP